MTNSPPYSRLSERVNHLSAQQLEPIYSKIKQLKEQQDIIQQRKRQKQYALLTKNTIFCKELNVHLSCNRGQSISKKRSVSISNFHSLIPEPTRISFGTLTNFNKSVNKQLKKQKIITLEELKMRPRTQRIKNFLILQKNPQKLTNVKLKQKQNRTNSAVSNRNIGSGKHPDIPQDEAKLIQQQIRSFSPIRPASRMSGTSSSLADKKLSQIGKSSSNRGTISRQNSFRTSSRNTIGMMSNLNSNKSLGKSAPAKYLRKGTRVRQALLRQLNVVDFDNGDQQLTYLKDYDQWVPATLASMRRQQLQRYMQILVGKKKEEQTVDRMEKFRMIYL